MYGIPCEGAHQPSTPLPAAAVHPRPSTASTRAATFLSWSSISRLCTQARLHFHVFAAHNAYIFTSLHPCYTCYNYVGNTLPPPKLKSIPIARSAEKPSSTMANLPARHRPNTHPAPSNCFQPSPNTSSRYHVHFSASDATSDRAIKVDTKRMKITPPRAISTTVLVSFEGRQSTPPSPMKNGVNMKN